MKNERKKQLFAIIVISMFIVSGIAIVFNQPKVEEEEQTPLMYNRLLSNSEEAEFLKKNMVVIRFFWEEDCLECEEMNDIVNEVFQELKGRMIVEKVNIYDYEEQVEILDIDSVPYLYLKGNTIGRVSGKITADELTTKLCELYFEPIEECYWYE